MKTMIFGLALMISGGYVNAACVGVGNSQAGSICAMVPDEATCNQLAGTCQWVGGSTTPPPSQCSGSNPVCGSLNDQQSCTMIPACHWN